MPSYVRCFQAQRLGSTINARRARGTRSSSQPHQGPWGHRSVCTGALGMLVRIRGDQFARDRGFLHSVWGNPTYGILGRAMETSASFEARSAPSRYLTAIKPNDVPTFKVKNSPPAGCAREQ